MPGLQWSVSNCGCCWSRKTGLCRSSIWSKKVPYKKTRQSQCLGQTIFNFLFQDDQLVDLSSVDLLPDDEDDDVLLKIDSELGGLQPGEADLLGTGGKNQEDFFKENRREESEALLNQILDTSSEVCFSFIQMSFHFCATFT